MDVQERRAEIRPRKKRIKHNSSLEGQGGPILHADGEADRESGWRRAAGTDGRAGRHADAVREGTEVHHGQAACRGQGPTCRAPEVYLLVMIN